MDVQKSKLAANIIEAIGGKENVKEYFHCVTRLRFYLVDRKKVKLDELKKMNGVFGAQYATEQLQIIIGNDVEDVFAEIKKKLGDTDNNGAVRGEKGKSKLHIRQVFETLAAIFLPVIPVLAGTGMLKGLIIILTTYFKVNPASGEMQILTITSDCVFYFFPFLIAWSAANRFKTNIPMSLALAGCLLYPIMTDGLAKGLAPIHFFGLPVPFVKYAASSIPIILTIWVLSYIHPLVDKLFPKVIRSILAPMIVMLIMTPLTLIVIAPLASYISLGLAALVKFLFDFSPIVAGAIVGGTRPLVVLSGMHLALGAVIVQNISKYGYDVILPVNTMGTLAMVGTALGVWYKSKNKETKSVSFSAFISAFIGVTEPTIYGVLLKFKNALAATMIGGGVAGAFVAFFKGTSSAYVNSSILSLPVFAGPGLKFVLIGMAISAVTSFIMVQILGLTEEKNTKSIKQNSKVDELGIYSPLSGEIVDLKTINDEVFSKNVMGKGIAIIPNDNQVVAPFDGTVSVVYPTKHAIGLTSNNGVEVIIHIGLDTVNLKGKYFDVKVEKGQQVTNGEVLAEVDFESIIKEGYSTVTPIIVLNSEKFLDVIPNNLSGSTIFSKKIIEVVK